MKTLTITEAKRNLGRWLTAAARGEDMGIVAGADIIAPRKDGIESTKYARHTCDVTPEHVRRLQEATDARHRRLKGKLTSTIAAGLKKLLG